MQIYNSMTRKKEPFVPLHEGKVGIYACGPTVYNFFHIGNARPFIVFDVLRRYLEYRGYEVTFVQNFTDIDDKMIRRANEEGVTVAEIAERYIAEYFTDAKALGIRPATVHPRATEHIPQIIALIQRLIDKGLAYESQGDVYYRVRAFPSYGCLCGQNLEDLESGARVSVDEVKEDPLDFALWKAQKPGEPAWESPWGMGRPGWHIECSAMSTTYLGETFDIHGGGKDLLFPHHENEIAQTSGATGKPYVRYWMHNGFINIDNEKMSKSKGNFFTVRDISREFDLEAVRLFMLSAQNTPYTSYTESDYQALWERRNDKKENPARPWVITDRRNGQQQYVYLANFDWYNYLYDDTRPTWDHNINIKGGSKALSYMVSGRYYQQKGINKLLPDMYKSYNFRAKLSAELRPWLTISSNTKFFQSNYKYYGYEDEYNNFRKPTLHALASFVPVNPDGTAVSHTSGTNSSTHYVMDGYNAMMQKGKSGGNKKIQEFTTTFEAEFKLHKNFNVKADFSYTQGYLHYDYRSVNVEYSKYPGVVETEPEGNFPNAYKETVYDQNYYVADVYGTYNKTFSDKHNLTLIAGYNYEAKYFRDLKTGRNGLLSEDLSDFNLATGTTIDLTGGRNEYAIMGWFYRAAYDYKGKYLFEMNGRYDGTSRFPRGKRFGFFPSFSAAHQRGVFLRTAAQHHRQPEAPFFVRFARQPADRIL